MSLEVRLIAALFTALLPLLPPPSGTDSSARAVMHVEVKTHTALQVSTSELHFDLIDEAGTPQVAVEYSAAARTRMGGPVVLTVEPLGELRTAGNTPVGLVVAYQGEGQMGGTLTEGKRHVVASWTGSGIRPGRVVFRLLGASKPGVYSLSLKFGLSAP